MNETPTARFDFPSVLAAMKDEGLDALVAMEPRTISLLLNYWNEIFIETIFRESPTCVVITSSGEIFAVMTRPHHRHQDAPWIDQFVGQYSDTDYYDQHAMVDALSRALETRGLGNAQVGFEMGFVPAGIMEWIKNELPGVEIVDGEWILWQMRAVKTEKELGFIKTAVTACEAGVEKMLGSWQAGKSIHRLLDDFEQVVEQYGASFFCTYQRALAKKWISFDGRDQRRSEDFIIRANDDQEVLFDLMVKCQAYISDWKRSFYAGTPPQEIEELYQFEWRVVQTLAKTLRPGMTTEEAQQACDERLKNEGLVNWWCIHSVGLDIHEEPLIGGCPALSETGQLDKTKTVLFPGLLRGGSKKITFQPNTVVMVETKSTEDPYQMTENGLQRLNTLPQKLFVV